MANAPFKLRSQGSSFKMMGSSPMKDKDKYVPKTNLSNTIKKGEPGDLTKYVKEKEITLPKIIKKKKTSPPPPPPISSPPPSAIDKIKEEVTNKFKEVTGKVKNIYNKVTSEESVNKRNEKKKRRERRENRIKKKHEKHSSILNPRSIFD